MPTYSFPEEKGTDTFFREATKEERESVDEYIKSISFPEREKGEPTEEQVKEYCKRRQLFLITYSAFRRLADGKADRVKGVPEIEKRQKVRNE